MNLQKEQESLYLIWKDPISRRQYMVGELTKGHQYEFKYCYEVQLAIEAGFSPLASFIDINKVYTSERLFPAFSSRLPDRKRVGIESILVKYGLTEYDGFELLKRSKAMLPIDNLSFDSHFTDGEPLNFNVAGVRHYLGCEGEDCDSARKVSCGDFFKVVHESNNTEDPNALQLLDSQENLIGYIPRYHCEDILKSLCKECDYSCEVKEVVKDKQNCSACIKAELKLFE